MSGALEAVDAAGRAEERMHQAGLEHAEIARTLYVQLRDDGFSPLQACSKVVYAFEAGKDVFLKTINEFGEKYDEARSE